MVKPRDALAGEVVDPIDCEPVGSRALSQDHIEELLRSGEVIVLNGLDEPVIAPADRRRKSVFPTVRGEAVYRRAVES